VNLCLVFDWILQRLTRMLRIMPRACSARSARCRDHQATAEVPAEAPCGRADLIIFHISKD
jgi:uncharacterized protein with PIN domain